MKLTAHVERSEGWWAVEVPEIDGLFTQAKRLDQVEEMVKDAATLLTDLPESEFEVALDIALPKTVAEHAELSRQLAVEIGQLQAVASALTRLTAAELSDEDLPLRDIGVILDVSFQRVGQLLKDWQTTGMNVAQCSKALEPFSALRTMALPKVLNRVYHTSEGFPTLNLPDLGGVYLQLSEPEERNVRISPLADAEA